MLQTSDPFRDPVYGVVRPAPICYQVIDTPAFQRLRRVRQLALAYLQYPSAVHTRFEHSVGVAALADRILDALERRGEVGPLDARDRGIIHAAAICHDLGQQIAGHLLEEFGAAGADHEEDGAAIIRETEIGELLDAELGKGAAEEAIRIICHRSDHPLAEIVAGDIDADKADYLRRDAYHCGVPISFDQGGLVDSMCLVEVDDGRRHRLGIEARGLSAFEGLLLAKARLFREVYFPPVVRCAMAMLRSLVLEAVDSGWIDSRRILQMSDDELFAFIRIDQASYVPPDTRDHVRRMAQRILNRNLFYRSQALPLSERVPLSADQVLYAERVIAEAVGLPRRDVILDIPSKPRMLGQDVPVRLPNGSIIHAAEAGPDLGFALPAAEGALYDASGSISLFTAELVDLPRDRLLDILHGALDSPSAPEDDTRQGTPVTRPVPFRECDPS